MHYFHLYYRYYKNVTEAILIQNIYLVNFFISFLFSPFIAQIQSVCIQIKNLQNTLYYVEKGTLSPKIMKAVVLQTFPKNIYSDADILKTVPAHPAQNELTHSENRTDFFINQEYNYRHQYTFQKIKWRHCKHYKCRNTCNAGVYCRSHRNQFIHG